MPFTPDFVIIQVDNTLRSYNVSSNTLSDPLYTFTSSDPSPFVADVEDGTNHYFSDGASLLKVPRNGTSTATLLIQDPAPITGVFITTGRVVYTAGEFSTSTTFTIKSISTGGGSATTLVESTEDFLDVVDGTQGDFVYYNRFPLLGGPPVAGAIKGDGSPLSEIPNAFWSGLSVRTSLAFTGGFVDRMVLIVGCDQNFVCSTVKTVLADTNSDEVFLGKLPSDIGFASFFGIGDDILGQGEIFATGSGDILYGRASVPDSLIRVTDTADRDEEVISVGDSD
ncbi:MAG: hypothetical protein HY037_07240 [Nitrospirae bacterium]|nr:hypothetical protein [Candidatus Troglogloeales bacterium]